MTLNIRKHSIFKRDIKRIRRVHDLSRLNQVIEVLVKGGTLEERHNDHPLTGNWKGYRDCHITPDWVLIYRIAGNELQLARTGSHSELF